MATRRKSNGRLYWVIGSLVLVLIVLLILRRQGVIGKDPALVVQVGEVESRNIYSRVTESGTIQPTVDVPVAPDVSGEVVFIAVQEGMRVKKNDLLLTIRPDDYEAILEQSQASLAQAKAGQLQAKASVEQAKANLLQDSLNFVRNKELFQDSVISQIEYENNKLQYDISRSQYESAKLEVDAAYYRIQNAEASVKQARQNLDRTNIYASMDGTITELNVEVGQRVVGTMQMAGTEILKVADLSSMEVVVEVNENDIINVSLGDSSRIEVDAFPDRVFYGKVTEIAYSANVAELGSTDQVTNFEVTVKISPESYTASPLSSDIPVQEASPFRPGMTSLVEIYTQNVNKATAIPIAAVTTRTIEKDSTKMELNVDEEVEEVVFVVSDQNVINKVPVKLGIKDDDYFEVKDGLNPGQRVVTGPYTLLKDRLEDGMTVEPEDNSKSRRFRAGK